MSSSDYISYNQEVTNFLMTMSIKYLPFVDAYNKMVISAGGTVDMTNPLTWKYYMNLAGEYHSIDTVMTVRSLDTRQTVDFTKQMLAVHPRTAKAYRPGTDEYRDLCARYPQQVDLIRSIIFPAESIDVAITAQEFTILAYGNGYLDPAEQDGVLVYIRQFLAYFVKRWYLTFLSYEPYFYWAFWGILWQNLTGVIFSVRMRNIQTNEAHTFHVWEKLKSRGLRDYRDVLTDTQARYLYRNIDFLIGNRGQQDTLRRLVDNILTTSGTGLVGKVIRQETKTEGLETCRWYPEFISEKVPTRYSDALPDIPPESVETIISRLQDSGDEVNAATPEYVERVSARLAATNLNSMATKLLEIRPLAIDKKYAGLLARFVMDTLVAMINRDGYMPEIYVRDDYYNQEIHLNGRNALLMFFYCCQKALGLTPTTIPTMYSSETAYRRDAAAALIPKTVQWGGDTYYMRSMVDPDAFVQGIFFPPSAIWNPADFSTLLSDQFAVLLRQVVNSRRTADPATLTAYNQAFNSIAIKTTYPVELSSHSTYTAWLASVEVNLAGLVSGYDELPDAKVRYNALASKIIRQLVPIPPGGILERHGDFSRPLQFYRRLKELFVQLCSYNVLFLDTEREAQSWCLLTKISKHVGLTEFTATYAVPKVPEKGIRHDLSYSIPIDKLSTFYNVIASFSESIPFPPGTDMRIRKYLEDTTYVGLPLRTVMGEVTYSHSFGVSVLSAPALPDALEES